VLYLAIGGDVRHRAARERRLPPSRLIADIRGGANLMSTRRWPHHVELHQMISVVPPASGWIAASVNGAL